MKNVIEIKNLFKSFKDIKAVYDLSFSVKEGELFAFLGLNGAGKSTTISIICGQLEKDQGQVIINGVDTDSNIESFKNELGVVFQNSALDKSLSVKDNLESRAALYNICGQDFYNRLYELADLLDFKSFLSKSVGKLSGGQRRKIDIARALIHQPKILILDEPTTGLDPQTRKLVWNVLNQLRKENHMTIFLTTHYMEEASDADYVIILDSGKIVAEGTPLQLKNQYTGDFITLYNIDQSDIEQLSLKYEKIRDAYRIEVSNTAEATRLIMQYPELFKDYEITKGKMDDVFLSITGKRLTGGDEK